MPTRLNELTVSRELLRLIAGRAAALTGTTIASILALSFGAFGQARCETPQRSYPHMAAVGRYLIEDSKAEIALARSAAPAQISNNATVLVLARNGYRTAITGTNGFICLVERSWMSPFDSPDFWNPKLRGPICYNPPASSTILPYTINRTTLVWGGLSKTAMYERIAAAVVKRRLPRPSSGAMSYMMSKGGYLGDAVGRWYPHLMFHFPTTTASKWGANLKGSPVMVNDRFRDVPEPETIFMIPVSHWSDGTAAPAEM